MRLNFWNNSLLILVVMVPLRGFAVEKSVPTSLSGYYAGISVGGFTGQYDVNTTTSLLYPSSAFFSNSNNSTSASSANFLGALVLGYLYPVNIIATPIRIGPEIYGSLGQPKFVTSQSTNATLPTESLATTTNGHLDSGEFGVDMRLGTLATPSTLLFGRLGAAFNKITVDTVSTISRPALPLYTEVNNSSSKSCVGLRVGGGIEQKITANLNFRADYIFTRYPSFNASAITQANSAAPIFQLGPIANTTSIQTSTNTILASLIYQINV